MFKPIQLLTGVRSDGFSQNCTPRLQISRLGFNHSQNRREREPESILASARTRPRSLRDKKREPWQAPSRRQNNCIFAD